MTSWVSIEPSQDSFDDPSPLMLEAADYVLVMAHPDEAAAPFRRDHPDAPACDRGAQRRAGLKCAGYARDPQRFADA